MSDEHLTAEERIQAERGYGAEIAARIDAEPSLIDEQAGDLMADARHVLRAGTTVVVSTWEGKTATEYGSEVEARDAFRGAAP